MTVKLLDSNPSQRIYVELLKSFPPQFLPMQHSISVSIQASGPRWFRFESQLQSFFSDIAMLIDSTRVVHKIVD